MNFLLSAKPFSVDVAVAEIAVDTVVVAVGYLETRPTAVVLPSDGIQHERNLTNFVRIRRLAARQNSYQNWFEYGGDDFLDDHETVAVALIVADGHQSLTSLFALRSGRRRFPGGCWQTYRC